MTPRRALSLGSGMKLRPAFAQVSHKAVLVPRRGEHRAALLEDAILAELALRRAAARRSASSARMASSSSAARCSPRRGTSTALWLT